MSFDRPVGTAALLLTLVLGAAGCAPASPPTPTADPLIEGTVLLNAGRAVEAVPHLEKALEARPDDLARWLLLGDAYKAAGREVAARAMYLEALRRAAGCPEGGSRLITRALIAELPRARIETPEEPIETPFRGEGEPPWKSYVAPTRFRIPDDCRPALFMHPPAKAVFRVRVPEDQPKLFFGVALDPQAEGWPGDGVTFQVDVDGQILWSEHLPKGHQGWKWVDVDLDAYSGREVDLGLQTLPGPAGDATGDWAGWAHPFVLRGVP